MKRRFTTKFMSIALMLSMVIVIFPLAVSANEAEDDNSQCTVDEVPFEFEYLPGDLTHEELKTAVLDPAEKPSVVSQAQIDEMQHVNRLYEQETDDYTVIFQNRDGGKTVYVFDRPVKSVSESGEVCDLSANAIVVASKKNTAVSGFGISSLGGQTVSAVSSNLKEMQNRLEAYKTSHNLNEYQMLPDKLQNATLTTAGLSTEMLSPMQITESNSVSVMSLTMTYSEFGGEYAFKCNSNNKYLTYMSNRVLMSSGLTVPAAKWCLSYNGEGQYYIINMARQNKYMTYYDGTGVDFVDLVEDESELYHYLWNVNFYWEDQCTFSCCDYQFGVNGEMEPYNEEVSWTLCNASDTNFLQNISISFPSVVVDPKSSYTIPSLTKSPTNASYTTSKAFTWHSTNENIVSFSADEMITHSAGVVSIYCTYRYSDIQSNTMTLVVGTPANIASGATYLIKSHVTSNMLTFDMNSNTPSLLDWVDNWETQTQAFTITQVGTYTYRISAILARNQYDLGTQTRLDNENIYVQEKTNKYAKSNTLYATSDKTLRLKAANSGSNNINVPNDEDLSQLWYIVTNNGLSYLCNVEFPNYYLTYTSDGLTLNQISELSSDLNRAWNLTQFGVDVPLVKQYKEYYCGAATTIQIMNYFQPNHTEYATQQDNLWTNWGYSANSLPYDGLLRDYLRNNVNANYINKSKSYFSYNYENDTNNIYNRLKEGILLGYPGILHPSGQTIKNLSYCGINYPYKSGHFICIIGCSEDKVLLSDCNFNNEYFGIHLISVENFYSSLGTVIIYTEGESS